jgi:hypothetical protein
MEVIGLDEPYTDYSAKIKAFHRHLTRRRRKRPGDDERGHGNGFHSDSDDHGDGDEFEYVIADDDIVVMLDAYDVLVTPAIRGAASVIASSPTPILFCAEHGVYPEYAGE